MLRNIEKTFLEINLNSLVVEGFIKFIRDFLYLHDHSLNLLLQIINYQQEKTFFNSIYICNDELKLSSNYAEDLHKTYMSTIQIYKYKKLTLLSLKLLYKQLTQYIFLLSDTCTKLLEIKKTYTNSNDISTEVLDLFYNIVSYKISFCYENEFLIYTDLFFTIVKPYLNYTYNFINNGNLIDLKNEYYIDHSLTKDDKKKIIFNFNTKFTNQYWQTSFGIKPWQQIGKGKCVPKFLLIDDMFFKILEAGRASFISKHIKKDSLKVMLV